jgi:hypothetical protein
MGGSARHTKGSCFMGRIKSSSKGYHMMVGRFFIIIVVDSGV